MADRLATPSRESQLVIVGPKNYFKAPVEIPTGAFAFNTSHFKF